MRLDRVILNAPLESVRALLLGVASRLDGGLTSGEVEAFCDDLEALAPDEDVLMEPAVECLGEEVPLVVDAFKDAAGTCEVVFIVPRLLADLVRDEVKVSCPEAEVRFLSGGSGDLA